MPAYEAILILKKMARPEVAKALKRATTNIFNNNGLLFGIENLGHRALPYGISAHGRRHKEGSYFLIRFDSSTTTIEVLKDEFRRDIDVVRNGFVRIRPEENIECTLDEEMKPPAYRQDVKDMIEEGRRREKYKFQPKTGLEYNPWRT
ncbi:putative 28S ribosomal protein S6, mitochondrial [Orchesella cincta]|uniref:Small ribosomal subunit protein bS6m n=1 Tax=Orchesella cincta TaxID=48709 RepID=A0A1D2NLR0_ORCCI|nr:putative 28S ribosomal protein S6, mitochondrial [Orchesella cincta]